MDESRVPDKVQQLKPSLRQYAAMDVSGYRLPGRRGVKPYADGGRVWVDPYLDSETERQIQAMWERIGENEDDTDAWAVLTELLDDCVWGFDNLTDKWGVPLPQPGAAGCWDAVPSHFMAHLIRQLAGGESEGEGAGA